MCVHAGHCQLNPNPSTDAGCLVWDYEEVQAVQARHHCVQYLHNTIYIIAVVQHFEEVQAVLARHRCVVDCVQYLHNTIIVVVQHYEQPGVCVQVTVN